MHGLRAKQQSQKNTNVDGGPIRFLLSSPPRRYIHTVGVSDTFLSNTAKNCLSVPYQLVHPQYSLFQKER